MSAQDGRPEFGVGGDFPSIVAAVRAAVLPGRRSLIAVDGIGGSGKTVFAAQLAAALAPRTSLVLHEDDFFTPAPARYARGRFSPEGFWLDVYDLDALTTQALDPLAPDGNGEYRAGSVDRTTGEAVMLPMRLAPEDAVVIVEGAFLHRDELLQYWDWSVYLDVPFEIAAERMERRSRVAVPPASRARYDGAQLLYFARADPRRRAALVVDNAVLGAPRTVARAPD